MSIRDFDNGGQHESPGSRCQKNKTIIFLLILFTKASTSNVSRAKFPHSPIHHYTSIYGALFFSVSPVRCTCIIKYGAVRKFFRKERQGMSSEPDTDSNESAQFPSSG